MRFLCRVLAAAIVSIAVAGPAYAQAIGRIEGKVTDNTGAVLPGVTVTVAGTGLQAPLTQVSSANGTYTFANVPIGTYSVTFELSSFKKGVRENVVLNSGFTSTVDMKMELGNIKEEVTVVAESPLVDTKKTTTGGDFTVDQMLKVPTARDPWQVINMAPGIVLSGGVNVGGSASGQQLTVNAFGSSGSVQWNLEGGNITDMSSNSSPMYFNFDSFQEIQVITGGGDVSVQSAGVFINLITKSGSNVFKGGADLTFENSAMQAQNVSQAQFNSNSSGGTGLSGNPLHRIGNYDGDLGGPIKKNKLWFWGSTDYQDINVGIANYFDTTKSGCNPPPKTFDALNQVANCLANDKTTIQDFNGKLNYQLNTTNKFQFLIQTDDKIRNNRGASANTTNDATQSQLSAGGIWNFKNPTYQLTHTWLPTDKLVFVNQMTYVEGGFFLDEHDTARCGLSTYARALAGQEPTDPTCQYNVQSLSNRTTGLASRNLTGTYQTVRPAWEVKTDDNYFLPHVLGGDHALKFGVGWRKDPVLTYTHIPGGSQDTVLCVGNLATNCGDGVTNVPVGSATGIVPRTAVIARDRLLNDNWWTWSSYIQDSYTSKRLTVSGGVRQDWQDSTFLGGCVNANVVLPGVLGAQCQGLQKTGLPFNNFSPRVSATYDLTGHGTTAIHASFSYYFQSKITLADSLSNLGTVNLTYGSNQNSGACSTAANSSCWTDANHDGIVQANELTGTPTPSTARFQNGVLTNLTPVIDPNSKIARTREAVVGVDHQLAGNLHVNVDYTYRYNDLGTQSYNFGLQPGSAGFNSAAALWVQETQTDPNTGVSAPYYVVCAGCVLPQPSVAPGTATTITATTLGYSTFNGASVTVTKRLSNRWQGNVSYSWNDFRGYTPAGSFSTTGTTPGNPTGIQFSNGFTNNTPRYTIKGYGSWEMPWYGLLASLNMNINDGAVRNLAITGPNGGSAISNCPPGTATAQCLAPSVTYTTLAFQNNGINRLPQTAIFDVAVAKNFDLGRQKLTVTLNCFNITNTNTVLSYSSNTISNNGLNGASTSFTQITSIVPPRVFRIDLRYAF